MTRRGNRGFVLVNALVLVAALAGIAALLLARAEGSRARLSEAQGAAQVTLYLDAFEALSIDLLRRDTGAVDHAGEAWALAEYDVPLDRGRVAGGIRDLQGLFNVNRLANPEDAVAREGLDLLVMRLGLSPGIAEAIAGFLSSDGPDNAAAYARQTPAIAPVGGPVLMLDQLLVIPDLNARDFARLRPYLTALPGAAGLNVNTAPELVMQSLIPGMTAAVANRLVQSRRFEPFQSVAEFTDRAGQLGAVLDLDEAGMARLTVGSTWFAAQMRAELEDHSRHRVTVFERLPLPAGIRVAYRLNGVP